jgi:hypothetical protein
VRDRTIGRLVIFTRQELSPIEIQSARSTGMPQGKWNTHPSAPSSLPVRFWKSISAIRISCTRLSRFHEKSEVDTSIADGLRSAAPRFKLALIAHQDVSIVREGQGNGRGVTIDKKYAWPTTGEGGEQREQAHLNSLTLDREGDRAVFPVPLRQNAQVFGAQHVLSSDAVTKVVVLVYLLVDVLWR